MNGQPKASGKRTDQLPYRNYPALRGIQKFTEQNNFERNININKKINMNMNMNISMNIKKI